MQFVLVLVEAGNNEMLFHKSGWMILLPKVMHIDDIRSVVFFELELNSSTVSSF